MTVRGFPERSPEPFLDRKELSVFFSVSVATVDRWVRAGCPSEVWGMRARRFQVSRVLGWLRGRGGGRMAA